MKNIRCTIGYDAVESRQMLVELLVREISPQDIVDGLLEGRLTRRNGPGLNPGDIVNDNDVAFARIVSDNRIEQASTPREFSLLYEHCIGCNMQVGQVSKDAGHCVECNLTLSPVIVKKITGGFVIQTFHGNRCVDQEFICGDQVTYENEDGDLVGEPEDEKYQPYFMVLNHPDGP